MKEREKIQGSRPIGFTDMVWGMRSVAFRI